MFSLGNQWKIYYVLAHFVLFGCARDHSQRPFHSTQSSDAIRMALTGTDLVGSVYIPAKRERRPAIIMLGGSEGGTFAGDIWGPLLATEGYIALSLAYFGVSGVPLHLANVPLEYFQKAIRYLQARPEVDRNKIGVMGASRGGELALLLGAIFTEIQAVVAQTPSPIIWGAESDGRSIAPKLPAWTYREVPLPYLQIDGLVQTVLADGRKAYEGTPAFLKAMQDKRALKRAQISIERINGPIFMTGGEDDRVWPSCAFMRLALKRLVEKSHPHNDRAICYPKAGHWISVPPGIIPPEDTLVSPFEAGTLLNLGGTPEGNASAQRDNWNRIVQFLRENL